MLVGLIVLFGGSGTINPADAVADSFPLVRNPILQFPIPIEQREALVRLGWHGTDTWKFLEDGGYFKRRVNSGGFVWYDWYERKPNGQFGLAGKAIREEEFVKLKHGVIRAARETAGRTTALSGLPTGSGSKTATALKTKVDSWVMTGQKNGGILRGKFLQAMSRLGQWRALGSWGFGTVGLAAMAFGLGWEMGGVVAHIAGIDVGNAGIASGPTRRRVVNWSGPAPAGQEVTSNYPGCCSAAVTPNAPYFTGIISPTPAAISVDWNPGEVASDGCYWVLDTADNSPAGATVMVEVGAPRPEGIPSGSCKSMRHAAFIVYAPMQIDSIGPGSGGDIVQSLPTEPNLATQEAAAEDILTDPDFAGIISDAVRSGIEAGEIDWPEGDMPPNPNHPVVNLKVPKPYGGESWQSYAARVADLGLDPQPQPALKRQRREDVDVGVVLQVKPAPGTNVGPGEPVKITWNPSDEDAAEDPETEGGSGWERPPIRDIDFSPISQAVSCNVFPFGLFCWAHETLGGFGAGGTCPSWEVEFSQGTLELDPCVVEPIMPAIRAMILLASVVGFVMMVAGVSLGVGKASGD